MGIAIIGAMEEEIAWLRKRVEKPSQTEAAGGTFYSGTLAGREVVLLRGGVGKVNAALTAALLIERWQPELIVNIGSAGGIGDGLRIGDVVVGTEHAYSDVDATAFSRYEYGQVPRMPARYKAAEQLVAAALRLAVTQPDLRVVSGLITTADSFIGNRDAADFIRTRFPESLVTDMESAAIAQAAYWFQVPFLAVRSVSDIAGGGAGELFEGNLELAALNSAKFALELISGGLPDVSADAEAGVPLEDGGRVPGEVTN